MPGSGGRVSGRRADSFDADYNFDIFSLKTDLTPTTFSGAIENFKGTLNDTQDSNGFEFDFAKDGTDIDTTNSPLTLNLSAKELKAGDSITLLSGARAVDTSSSRTELQPTSRDRIEFTLYGNELASLGVDELTLVISDTDPNAAGIQAGGKTIDAALATANGSSQNDAIEYIIDNNLFSSVSSVRVSGGSIDGSGQIVSNESGTFLRSFTPNEGRPDVPGTGSGSDSDDVLTGDNGDNTLNGGEGNNVLRGQEGNDVLTTGGGSDNLDGGNGNDTLSSGGGNDTLTGGAGADNIDGGDGNDTLDGGSENDLLLGGGGDDLINGGNGNDTLNGGAGQDVLVGDGGADIFALNTLGGADVIRDFNYGQDLIGLSDGITFDDLTITQGNGAAIISYQGQDIGSVSGATPSQLGESFFTAI